MTREEMMPVIHRVWFHSRNALVLGGIWNLSDGYGFPGFVPPQGYDWSGIRDSSDDAVKAMYAIAITDPVAQPITTTKGE